MSFNFFIENSWTNNYLILQINSFQLLNYSIWKGQELPGGYNMRLINSKEKNNQMLFISLPLFVPDRHLDINVIYSEK